MATTYGRLRFEVLKIYPGVDLNIIDGFAFDRYQEVLGAIDWKRQDSFSAFSTPATYNTGTVTVVLGSNAIVGVGTTWTAEMSNRIIRIGNAPEYYNFTFTDATHGTLDRVYSAASGSGVAYRIDRNVYPMPPALRTLDRVEIPGYGELIRGNAEDFDSGRQTYGHPTHYAIHMDSTDDQALIQMELWPVPEQVYTVNYWWHRDGANPTASTATALPTWINNGALKYGVLADVATHLKETNQALAWEVKFGRLLQSLVAQNSRVEGGRALKLASRFTRHRLQRYRG